jgi:hypothetical protein
MPPGRTAVDELAEWSSWMPFSEARSRRAFGPVRAAYGGDLSLTR